MALTERDITVAGVNCKELLSLTGYIMHCYQQYKDFNYLHIDPVKTPLEELRQKIVAEQKKLVVIVPELIEDEEKNEMTISWYCDDTKQLKARELELRKIFRACFISDLVPIENGVVDVNQKSEALAINFFAHTKLVNFVNN